MAANGADGRESMHFIRAHQWLNPIRIYPRYPWEKASMSVHSRFFAPVFAPNPAGHIAHFKQGKGADLGLWHQCFNRVHRIQCLQNAQKSFDGRARASLKVVQSAQRDTRFVGQFALGKIAVQPERPQPFAQDNLQFIGSLERYVHKMRFYAI
jgi:hypothetical protein